MVLPISLRKRNPETPKIIQPPDELFKRPPSWFEVCQLVVTFSPYGQIKLIFGHQDFVFMLYKLVDET